MQNGKILNPNIQKPGKPSSQKLPPFFKHRWNPSFKPIEKMPWEGYTPTLIKVYNISYDYSLINLLSGSDALKIRDKLLSTVRRCSSWILLPFLWTAWTSPQQPTTSNHIHTHHHWFISKSQVSPIEGLFAGLLLWLLLTRQAASLGVTAVHAERRSASEATNCMNP